VADTGPGIAPELAERVFELFAEVPGPQQTDGGLGLAIVATIAKAHGGRAEQNLRRTRGAVFHVRLPSTPGAAATAQGSPAPLRSRAGGKDFLSGARPAEAACGLRRAGVAG